MAKPTYDLNRIGEADAYNLNVDGRRVLTEVSFQEAVDYISRHESEEET